MTKKLKLVRTAAKKASRKKKTAEVSEHLDFLQVSRQITALKARISRLTERLSTDVDWLKVQVKGLELEERKGRICALELQFRELEKRVEELKSSIPVRET